MIAKSRPGRALSVLRIARILVAETLLLEFVVRWPPGDVM
jgi:hypothetical protein